MLSIQNIQLNHQHHPEEVIEHPSGRNHGILMQFTSQAKVLTSNGMEDVYPGDCMLVFRHTPAYIGPAEHQKTGFSNSYIVFNNHSAFYEASKHYQVPHNCIIHEMGFSAIHALFDQIYIEKAMARPMYQEQMDLLLRQLLLLLGRSAARDTFSTSFSHNHSLMGRLQTIRQDMYLDLTMYQTVQSMADAISVSPGYFRTLYKSLFGISPKQDILIARIEKSKSLLTLTDASIAQIAEICGFTDENYFARCFKAQMQISPSAYRKQYVLLHPIG